MDDTQNNELNERLAQTIAEIDFPSPAGRKSRLRPSNAIFARAPSGCLRRERVASRNAQ